MRKLTHRELVERQSEKEEGPIPVTVLVNDVRSLYNVGSIFRTSDGAGIEKLWLCGITGFPPEPRITKTALGAEASIPWEYHPDACFVLRNLKAAGYRIVLLEQTESSLPYDEYRSAGPVCLVLGNEITGVSDELLSLCDDAVEIEMAGKKNSLNVTVAYGILVYRLRSIFRKRTAARAPS